MRDLVFGALGLLIAASLAAAVVQQQRRFHRPLLTTPFQAVTLVDGRALVGRIDHLGTDFPVLRDAMTLQRTDPPAGGAPRYEAVRRRSEATGADHLIFPAAAILFVEPVAPDSAIGLAIRRTVSRTVDRPVDKPVDQAASPPAPR